MTAPAPPLPTRAPRTSAWWWLAAALVLFVALYSLRYVIVGEAAYVPNLAASFRARPVAITLHTLFGPLALVLGLINLLPAMRRRRWAAHRVVGRVYVASALAVGIAGGYLSLFAAGGGVARLGFGLLALCTVGSTAQAWLAIRGGRVERHREWMLRSYAFIFAAVMLRLWLPLLVVAYGGRFDPAYRWVAWVSWVPNLLWVEWRLRRGWRPAYIR